MSNYTNFYKQDNCVQWINQPVLVTISGTTAVSSQLGSGRYRIIATTAMYFRQGTSAAVATSSDHYLPAGQEREVVVIDGTSDGYIAGIQVSTSGVLQIHKIDPRS